MIDELERLFPEEEEEPEGEGNWLPGIPRFGMVRAGRGASEGGEEEKKAPGREKEETLSKRVAWEQETSERSGARGARAVYEHLSHLRRAVRTRQGSDTGTQQLPLRREGVRGEDGEWDLSRLDRAVRRDARRYDGGFTWQ